jgi:hypothetical protein
MLLATIGMATINLSSTVISGISPSFMVMIGTQISALGILALVSFIANKGGHACLIRSIPNYTILLFFLLLVPAAFLI